MKTKKERIISKMFRKIMKTEKKIQNVIYYDLKSQISTTMVWMVAVIILSFILIIYLFYVGTMGGLKVLTQNNKVEWQGNIKGNMVLYNDFYYFLMNKVDFNNKNVTIKQLVKLNDDNALKLFKDFAGKFAENEIEIYKNDNGFFKIEKYWIRIYDINEKIEQDYHGKYSSYEIGDSWLLRFNKCNPYDDDSDLIRVNVDEKLLIVFCVKYGEK